MGPLSLMFGTSSTQTAKNLLLEIVKDAEVGSKTSSIIGLAKNLSASLGIAKNTKVGDNDDYSDDKTIKRLPFSKKLNVPKGYFTSLCSNADSIFFKIR